MPHRPPPVRLATLGLILAALLAPEAAAHVEYVADNRERQGDPWAFVAGVASEPANLALLAAGAIGGLVAVALALVLRRRLPDVRILVGRLEGYADLVPWMLRLSVGLPLVGAGFAGYLFTPVLPVGLRVVQVLLGFLLLLGLATRAAAAVTLVAYLAALAVYGPDLLLAGEYVAGLLAILLLGPGRPSADDMLQHVASSPRTFYHRVDPVHRWAARVHGLTRPYHAFAPVVVRVFLGATFVYLGLVEKLLQPDVAMDAVRDLRLDRLLPLDPRLWVLGAALTEIVVGVALVAGFLTRATAALAFLVLTTTLLGLPDDPVLPHISLFGLASVVFTLGAGPWSIDRWLDRRRY